MTLIPVIDIWPAGTLMPNCTDELAARDNYHGHATWRRIIEAVGQLVDKTPLGALH